MAIDTIKSTAVLDGTIATADIADDAVTSAKLDTNISVAGNLLTVKTASNVASVGFEAKSDGAHFMTRDGGEPLKINRKTSDGNFIGLAKDGASVGSIGSVTAGLEVNSTSALVLESNKASTERKIEFGNDYFGPDSGDDNAIDLGRSGARFNDVFLGGGAYLGGTGSANYLDDYEEGTWTPVWSQGITGHSYLVQQGRYTKVGNRVTMSCYLRSSGGSSNGSHVYLSGFPFTATNTITAADGAFFTYGAGFYSGSGVAQWLVINNSNLMALYRTSDGAALGGTSSGVTMNTDVRVVISYQTDA